MDGSTLDGMADKVKYYFYGQSEAVKACRAWMQARKEKKELQTGSVATGCGTRRPCLVLPGEFPLCRPGISLIASTQAGFGFQFPRGTFIYSGGSCQKEATPAAASRVCRVSVPLFVQLLHPVSSFSPFLLPGCPSWLSLGARMAG